MKRVVELDREDLANGGSGLLDREFIKPIRLASTRYCPTSRTPAGTSSLRSPV